MTRSSACHGVLAFLVVLLGSCPGRAAASEKKPLKVLFIGSSYTMYNSMTKMVQGLSRKVADKPPLECTDVIIGGSSFQTHWENAKSLETLRNGAWDIVVLQGHHYVYHDNEARDLEYGLKLAEEVKKKNARLVFYMIWPDNTDRKKPENLERIRKVYADLHAKTGGTVAPAGVALVKALEKRPDLEKQIYFKDGYHPGPFGSYLVACAIFAAIYDRTPVGLPGTLFATDLDEQRKQPSATVHDETAKFLQTTVWETVEGERKPATGSQPK